MSRRRPLLPFAVLGRSPVAVVTLVVIAVASCSGGGAASGDSEAGAVSDGAGNLVVACPKGSVFFPDGAGGGECVAVGPQGYDELFATGDPFAGLPTGYPPGVPGGAPLADCPKGTVPTFAASRGLVGEPECTPVGPQGCDPIFIDPESGLCSPKSSLCPEGTIPGFELGCIDLDVDPETGLGCGEGPWGHLEALPGDVHVDPLADPAAADGSRAHPWPLIAQALGQVEAGGRIVLSKGLHTGGIKLTKAVTLEGACPSEVTIGEKAISAPYDLHAVLHVSGAPGVNLRGLEITGPGVGVLATAGAELALDRVVIREATTFGLGTFDGETEVSAVRLLVESTLSDPAGGAFGAGVDVHFGGHLTLSIAVLRKNRGFGLVVTSSGTDVDATGLLVEGTLVRERDTTVGWGVNVRDGGRLVLGSAALRGNREAGVVVHGSGTVVEATGLLVEGTLGRDSDKKGGRGVNVLEGGHLLLGSATLRENRDVGLWVFGSVSEVEATGLLVEGTLGQDSDKTGGWGVTVLEGGRLVLDSATLRGNRAAGLIVDGAGTEVEASGLLVGGTFGHESDGTGGLGVDVAEGGHLVLDSAVLRENRAVGLLVRDFATEVEATGLLVEGTLAQESDKTGGRGVDVQEGGRLVLDSATLRENRDHGLFVAGSGVEVEVTGLLVEKTLPQDSDGGGGRGIAVQSGGRLVLLSGSLRENRNVGLLVTDGGTDVDATGVLVEGTLPEEATGRNGSGLWVQQGGSLSLAGAEVRGSHMAGLMVYAANVTVVDSLFEGTLVGFQGSNKGLGDGVVATGSTVTLDRVLSRDNLRAGFVFDATSGTAKGLVSVGNVYGLVVQGGGETPVAPSFEDEVVFLDNDFETNEGAGDLPVADEPIDTSDLIEGLESSLPRSR